MAGYKEGVSASRLRALSYLGYRAVVAQPVKRLRYRGSGLERFLASYAGEGLVPTRDDDRAIGEAAAACVACGLCETGCELATAVPMVRSLGLEAAFRLYGWSDEGEAADALGTTADRVRAWRSGRERMEVADYMALTTIVNVGLVDAMKAGKARTSEIAAAAEALGVRPG